MLCGTECVATTMRHPHTVIGVFRSSFNAYVALRRLDRAGLPAQNVSLVAGKPELEAELRTLPHAPRAAIAGAAIGVLIGATYVVFGAPGLLGDVLGILLAIAGAVAAGIVGFVVGHGIARRASRWRDFEHVVNEGGAIVSVACVPDVCDRTKDVLKRSGANRIIDV